MLVDFVGAHAWINVSRDQLLYAYDAVVHVDVLDSHDSANLELLGRPDLGMTFTKLQCWRLTQYSKCVFLDADTLVGFVITARGSDVSIVFSIVTNFFCFSANPNYDNSNDNS